MGKGDNRKPNKEKKKPKKEVAKPSVAMASTRAQPDIGGKKG